MNQRLATAVLLLMSIAIVSAAEWYEQGHQQHLLDWSNFDTAIQQPGKFKFIKFFTRNCRYCRLLKQVEEQLREEKQWSFNFYAVDCSLHYDLCMTKAAMTAFPFVGIYDAQGALHGTIGGFYPLETMREAFNTIEIWQVAEQLAHNGPQVVLPDPKTA
jgi:thioredoxin-related protein